MRKPLPSLKDFAKQNNAGLYLNVKVILMSGYTADIVSENGVLEQALFS